MSGGPWRIIIDSWITDEANWYGRRTFVVDANDLRAALMEVVKMEAPQLLDEERLKLRKGKPPKRTETSRDRTA